MPDKPTPAELKRRHEEAREKAIASFPYQRVETTGAKALAEWEVLAKAGRGSPVVIGDTEAFTQLAGMMPDVPGIPRKSPQEIVHLSATLRHPDDMLAARAQNLAKALDRIPRRPPSSTAEPVPDFAKSLFPNVSVDASNKQDLIAAMTQEYEPELGDWPDIAPEMPELSVAYNSRTGAPLSEAHIVVVPSDDWTTIPAYLRWGNWNDCPAPEYHIAALRSWRDRYGAQLVGISSDVINIRVRQRPKTKEEALELAREQYAYCSDIVDQGVGTLSALAAALLVSDWWYFWWD